MTREKVKKLLPVLIAYSEGKEIQIKLDKESPYYFMKWLTIHDDIDFKYSAESYRIRPNDEYRPFTFNELISFEKNLPENELIELKDRNGNLLYLIGYNKSKVFISDNPYNYNNIYSTTLESLVINYTYKESPFGARI